MPCILRPNISRIKDISLNVFEHLGCRGSKEEEGEGTRERADGRSRTRTATQERIVVYSEITVICMRRRETEGGRDARERVAAAAETARARACVIACTDGRKNT